MRRKNWRSSEVAERKVKELRSLLRGRWSIMAVRGGRDEAWDSFETFFSWFSDRTDDVRQCVYRKDSHKPWGPDNCEVGSIGDASRVYAKRTSSALRERSLLRLASAKPFDGRRGRRVLCHDNGRVYDSLQAAAHALGVSHGALYLAIRDRRGCLGTQWSYFDHPSDRR